MTHAPIGSFRLVEREIEPNCHEIRVEGELELLVADRFKEALQHAAAAHERVLIDLRRCDFIDSTGIATIVQIHNEMEKRGRRVALYGASGQVRRVLSITGLTDNGLVFESAEDAISET